ECDMYRIQFRSFEKKEKINQKRNPRLFPFLSFSLWDETWIETAKPKIIQQDQSSSTDHSSVLSSPATGWVASEVSSQTARSPAIAARCRAAGRERRQSE